MNTIDLKNIKINDSFWNKYTKLVTKEIIPYQWAALNDQVEDAEPSFCIANFKIAAGLEEGDFNGFVFQDTDLAKWLEAVAFSLSYEPNEELEKVADEAIELIGKAQEENGYLDTYFTIKHPGQQFCNLKEGHELYTAGHMIEAAVAYYKVTGKERFLNIMRKTADLICEVFHTDRYMRGVPGHEEIELALFKLYEVTGDEKYCDMARDFIDRRGVEPNYLRDENSQEWFVDVWHDTNPYRADYSQAHLPVRQQKSAEGHAVRAVYLYSAMADIAGHDKDETLMEACKTLYDNIVNKRMYITGGIGSSGVLERFTCDYDLPNDSNYSESCASIGLAMFCRRMAKATGEASYIDTMELALMNTVLSGIAMDGKSFFYVNPLEVWPDNCMDGTSLAHVKPVRQKWFGCACCPPNIARTLASLGEYTAFVDEDRILFNMFVGSSMDITMGGEKLHIDVASEFPWKGSVKYTVSGSAKGIIGIRIPEYAKNFSIKEKGNKVDYTVEKGYAIIKRDSEENCWCDTQLEVLFDMPAQILYANPAVRADMGKVAIKKGPLVYCLEEVDNGAGLSDIYIDTNSKLTEMFDDSILGGVNIIMATGKRVKRSSWNTDKLYAPCPVSFEEAELTFVPYANWGNRDTGEMMVWVKGVI